MGLLRCRISQCIKTLHANVTTYQGINTILIITHTTRHFGPLIYCGISKLLSLVLRTYRRVKKSRSTSRCEPHLALNGGKFFDPFIFYFSAIYFFKSLLSNSSTVRGVFSLTRIVGLYTGYDLLPISTHFSWNQRDKGLSLPSTLYLPPSSLYFLTNAPDLYAEGFSYYL